MLFVPPSIPTIQAQQKEPTTTLQYITWKQAYSDGIFSIEFPDDCPDQAGLDSTNLLTCWTIKPAGSNFALQYAKRYDNKLVQSSVGFYDSPLWKTSVQVFEHEHDSVAGKLFKGILDISATDSEVLENLALYYKIECEREYFAGDPETRPTEEDVMSVLEVFYRLNLSVHDLLLVEGGRDCVWIKAVDSYIFYTNDNKKMYIVKEAYSIDWWNLPGFTRHPDSPRPVIFISGMIYEENNIWEIMAESIFFGAYDLNNPTHEHDDAIIHMMKSFSVEPTSTTHSTVLTLDLIPSKLKVGDNIRFSGTLKTTDGNIVQGANITIKSTKLGVLYTIQTDNNGKFATNFEVPIGWSGLSHELFVIYDDSCDYSVFACSDYNHKTGKYDNYNSKSQLHSLTISSTPTPTPTESVTAIPGWIKNNAGWWAEGQIDDSSFLQGIQFLIKEGIMVIPPTATSESSGSEGVPAWIKNNAGWWAEGQIDDSSFLQGIQYLVKEGIIKVG